MIYQQNMSVKCVQGIVVTLLMKSADVQMIQGARSLKATDHLNNLVGYNLG